MSLRLLAERVEDVLRCGRTGALGWRGTPANVPASSMPAAEVITSYHDLWHVEQSFRMSKTDLAARPMFHHQREAIEAHLTIVFTALAVARHLQNATRRSIRRIVQALHLHL